jgi:hypothetical protein
MVPSGSLGCSATAPARQLYVLIFITESNDKTAEMRYGGQTILSPMNPAALRMPASVSTRWPKASEIWVNSGSLSFSIKAVPGFQATLEAKPLPYLLSQMNLLLHGVEAPNLSPTNSLAYFASRSQVERPPPPRPRKFRPAGSLAQCRLRR